jgi:hypothetical protein
MNSNEVANTQNEAGIGLVDAPRLLEILFPNKSCRPSLRWLRDQQKRRAVPYCKIGRLVFFIPERVRAAFEAKAIAPRGR